MKTSKIILLSFVFFFSFFSTLQSQTIEQKYHESFSKLIEYHSDAKTINACLEKLYPVAIAEDSSYYIFRPGEGSYYLSKKAKRSGSLPAKIRAAFPLAEYDNQFVCVVTGDVFDYQKGYATILHEFVHCYQGMTVEWELKTSMDAFNRAMEEKNYMWELNHNFPYENKEISALYKKMIFDFRNGNPTEALNCHQKLKEILSKDDFDYMCWQEWKEGFARFIENKIRVKWGLEKNITDTDDEMNRVWFYEGGSLLITYLETKNKTLTRNLKSLYTAITK